VSITLIAKPIAKAIFFVFVTNIMKPDFFTLLMIFWVIKAFATDNAICFSCIYNSKVACFIEKLSLYCEFSIFITTYFFYFSHFHTSPIAFFMSLIIEAVSLIIASIKAM